MARRRKKIGRPSVYRPAFCVKAANLALQGATDREIAEAINISETSLYRWKHEHPEFREAMVLGKDASDSRVEQSLYRRAVGYSFDALHISQFKGKPVIVPYVEHVPPDPQAMTFWLKNRKPEKWRDRHEVEAGDSLIEFLKGQTPPPKDGSART